MGYSHLLTIEASLANFRAVYDIPGDVYVAYCHEDDITLQRHSSSNVVFFPLMSILEGGVRFPVDPFILGTLRFYRVVSCVSRLNRLYGLQLNHHDINFIYSLCGNIRSDYYLKVRDVKVRLISCLPDSNKNSAGEYVRVSANWLVDELTCRTSPRDIGRYCEYFTFVLI